MSGGIQNADLAKNGLQPVGIAISGTISDHDVLLRLLKAVESDDVPVHGPFTLGDLSEIVEHVAKLGDKPFEIVDGHRGRSGYEHVLKVCDEAGIPYVLEVQRIADGESFFRCSTGKGGRTFGCRGTVDAPVVGYDEIGIMLRFSGDMLHDRLASWRNDVDTARKVAKAPFSVRPDLLDEIRNGALPAQGRGLL